MSIVLDDIEAMGIGRIAHNDDLDWTWTCGR